MRAGLDALASRGPGGARCRVDQVQPKELERVLDQSPAAYGWVEDQRWKLLRITRPIFELFPARGRRPR